MPGEAGEKAYGDPVRRDTRLDQVLGDAGDPQQRQLPGVDGDAGLAGGLPAVAVHLEPPSRGLRQAGHGWQQLPHLPVDTGLELARELGRARGEAQSTGIDHLAPFPGPARPRRRHLARLAQLRLQSGHLLLQPCRLPAAEKGQRPGQQGGQEEGTGDADQEQGRVAGERAGQPGTATADERLETGPLPLALGVQALGIVLQAPLRVAQHVVGLAQGAEALVVGVAAHIRVVELGPFAKGGPDLVRRGTARNTKHLIQAAGIAGDGHAQPLCCGGGRRGL